MTAPAEPIRVLLVEDNDVYRESLSFLLGREEGLDVVAALPDGESAGAAAAEHAADVVVIDFRLPGIDGGEAAAEVRARRASAAVILLSASSGDEEYHAAASAGVPLVRKDEGIDAVVRAVREAAARVTR